MGHWNPGLLNRIAASDDLHIAPLRDDLTTYGTPTWVWSVVVDGNLYVRAYNGQNSRWHRSAMNNKKGRMAVADQTIDVAFEPVSGPINERIDDAYRAKYSTSSYLAPMISTKARASTIRLTPAA